MDVVLLTELLVILLLFVLSALCSLAETSLIGMNKLKIFAYIKNNHKAANDLKLWLKDPNKLLSTIVILNNAIAIGVSTIGAFFSLRLSEIFKFNVSLTATINAMVITFFIIIFGEITPKIFALHNTEKLGLFFITPVVVLYKILRPITEVVVKISRFIITSFGGKPVDSIPIITAKEINTAIDIGAEQGFINEMEKKMMSHILELGDLRAKDVMVPRTSIVALDVEWPIDKILDVVIEEGYTRMPVYKGNIDNIVGVIYTKDMLGMIKNRGLIVFQDLIRIPYFVPETKYVDDLLKEFKKGKIHMAIVVDEFGGTAGMITLEDILEEIVGDIKDEYDIEEKEVEQIDNKTYIVKGKTEIEKINNFLGMDIPVEDDVNTIGGAIMAIAGRVPKSGEIIKVGNVQFVVLKSDERKIERIKIEKTD
ncbi:MAG: HlyC/CorC family transporter [Candidatus Goldbacteria bacterium]|nr:HlyC/CorC family transporter [Candidatus Goldiibacteriota bacterium]